MKKSVFTPAVSLSFRLTLGAMCLATLTACGAGSPVAPAAPVIPTPTGGTGTPGATPAGPLTAPQERIAATTLVGRFAPAGQPTYTALSVVPTTASAVYNGYFYGDLANRTDTVTDNLIGVLQMRVAFNPASVAITGTVKDLSDADGNDIGGTLQVSNGALSRDGNPANDATLTANVAGTLTDSDSRKLVLGVRLEGDFLGTVPDGVGGEALGAVMVGDTSQDFDGGFIAAR